MGHQGALERTTSPGHVPRTMRLLGRHRGVVESRLRDRGTAAVAGGIVIRASRLTKRLKGYYHHGRRSIFCKILVSQNIRIPPITNMALIQRASVISLSTNW